MWFVFFFVDKFKKFWTPSVAPAMQTPQTPAVKLHSLHPPHRSFLLSRSAHIKQQDFVYECGN
jgi:hypothetical protein